MNYVENETQKDTGISTEKTIDDNAALDGFNTKTAEQKVFTQEQLETLINERIKRERKNARSLNSLKQLLKSCSEKGIISGGSYANMAKELEEKLCGLSETAQKQEPEEPAEPLQENDALTNEENEHQEYIPQKLDFSYEVKRREHEDNHETETEAAVGPQNSQNVSVSTSDLIRLKELYPKADLNELFDNEAFLLFSKGKNAGIDKLYEDFLRLEESLEASKNSKSIYSDAASTAFSSHSKAYVDDYSKRLTRRQMDIADKNGMSYREYGELLSQVPASPKKKYTN